MAIRKLNPLASEKILDIGCGIGNLTTKIAEKTCDGKVIGIDIDKNMISYANAMLKENHLKNLTYSQLDGIDITFLKEFDAIFSNIVIHWIKNITSLFEKLYTSLKEGGRMLIATLFDDSEINTSEKEKIEKKSQVELKKKISEIELRILQEFMIKGYHKEIITMEEFQAYQSQVNKNLTYKLFKIPEFEEMLKKIGFKNIHIDQQTLWNEFEDVGKYLEYRTSNLWLFFLGYFPEKYRPQLIAKLRQLIFDEWAKIPPEHRELPFKEKWPVLFIYAEK